MARLTPDQTRHDALLAEGRDAVLAGDKARAQALLQQALTIDPHSEEAWLWLSGTYTEPADMRACLEHVLAINPHNEHAREGLAWLDTHYGTPDPEIRAAIAPPEIRADPEIEAPPVSEPVALHPRRALEPSAGLLLEAALHPFTIGALLGLLRLVGWLRPQTLAFMRDDGPLTWSGGLTVALVAALTHGGALALAWLLVGWQISRARVEGRNDRFDSLVRSGQVWLPGYITGGALVIAALGVGTGQDLWRVLNVACWVLLLLGAVLIGRQLAQLLKFVGVTSQRGAAARILGSLVLISVLALGLAGIATAALLR